MITPVYFLLSLFGCAPEIGHKVGAKGCKLVELVDSAAVEARDFYCEYSSTKNCPTLTKQAADDQKDVYHVSLGSDTYECASVRLPVTPTAEYTPW